LFHEKDQKKNVPLFGEMIGHPFTPEMEALKG
jgi:hypothetical protein